MTHVERVDLHRVDAALGGQLDVLHHVAPVASSHYSAGQRILRYDGMTGAFLDVFVSAGSGRDLVFGPDGDLYVSTGNNVLRYDGTTGAFVGVFASGGGLQVPYGLAFGPDGNLYVADYGSNAVLRFDGTSGAFIDVFASGTNTNPTHILFHFPAHAPSAIIAVDTTADDLVTNGNCTLREAIRAANLDAPVDYCAAGSGFDFIDVPAGIYHLTRAGDDEDDGLTGDLDLRSGIALQGAGSALTVIDADGLGDRVLHVMPPYEGPDIQVEIRDLTVRGGSAPYDAFDGSTQHPGGGILIGDQCLREPYPLSGPCTDFEFYPNTTIEGCVIEDNVAGVGGGIRLAHPDGGATTISKTSIRSNTATGPGGAGIDSFAASVFLLDSTVEGNVATDVSTVAVGGIYDKRSMTIRSSTIAGNQSMSHGPGGILALGGSMSIGNSTISGNRTYGSGGGISVGGYYGGARVSIEFTTISGNVAGEHGGGISVNSNPEAVATVLGTIIAGNNPNYGGYGYGADVKGDFASRGDNLIGDGGASTGFTEAGDQVGTSANPIDALLGPLADNGGLTETQALAVGSPARDAADCLGMVEDQRHEPRPAGSAACDIGAFELPEPGQGLLLGAGIALLGLLERRRRR